MSQFGSFLPLFQSLLPFIIYFSLLYRRVGKKEFLKQLCCALLLCTALIWLCYKGPPIIEFLLTSLGFDFEINAQGILFFINISFNGYLIIQGLCYYFRICLFEKDLPKVLLDIRKKIDAYQERVVRRANKKKSRKKVYLAFDESQESESRNSERVKEIDEEHDRFIEDWNKSCDYCRNLLSETGESLTIR